MFKKAFRVLATPTVVWEKCKDAIRSALCKFVTSRLNSVSQADDPNLSFDLLKQDDVLNWIREKGLASRRCWVLLVDPEKFVEQMAGSCEKTTLDEAVARLKPDGAKKVMAVVLTNLENKICSEEDITLFKYSKLEDEAPLFKELQSHGGVVEIAE